MWPGSAAPQNNFQLQKLYSTAQGDDIVPIPGTKRRHYLEENAAAVNIELTSTELEQINEQINAVAPQGVAAGDRYADMSTVNR